jgi:hypothetical protein
MSTTLVTDLLLTDAFLIKGVVDQKNRRLSDHLDEFKLNFISIRDARLIDIRSRNVIKTPRILVNMERIVLAHEFLDTGGDLYLKHLAEKHGRVRVPIRAFYVGPLNFEIAGEVRPGCYDVNNQNKRFFIVEEPKIRGIEFKQDDELAVLSRLPYLIVAKDRLSYIYDFNE